MAFTIANFLSRVVILSVVLGANAAGECAVESEAMKLAPCMEAAQNANAPVSTGCCNAVHNSQNSDGKQL